MRLTLLRTSSGRPSRPLLALAACLVTMAAYPLAGGLKPAGADPVANEQAQANTLAAQINAQGQVQNQLAEQYDLARIRVDSVNDQVAAAKAQLAQTEGRVAAIESRLRQDAVTSFMDGSSAQTVNVLNDPRYEALVGQQYVDALAGDQRQTLSGLHQARQALQAREQALQKDQQGAQAALGQVASANQAAAAQTAALNSTLAKVKGDLVALVAQAEQQQAGQTAVAAVASLGHASGAHVSAPAAPAPPPSGGAATAVYWAEQALGKPYEYGAAGPGSFDCSGLTMWAWEHAGVSLPHSSSEQYQDTTRVSQNDLQPGDLIFEDYGGGGPWPGHVGIYVGNGQMVVADHTGSNVQYAPAIRPAFVGAGRVR